RKALHSHLFFMATSRKRPGRIGRGKGYATDKNNRLTALDRAVEARGIELNEFESGIVGHLPPGDSVEIYKRWLLLVRCGKGTPPLGVCVRRSGLEKARKVAAKLGSEHWEWFNLNAKICEPARPRKHPRRSPETSGSGRIQSSSSWQQRSAPSAQGTDDIDHQNQTKRAGKRAPTGQIMMTP
ncbi:hypothetical protein FOZ63_014360, partial [Perkinsus olseni]